MPILRSETSLTSDQFATLSDYIHNTLFKATLYQWNPAFELDISGISFPHFDTVQYDDQILRLSTVTPLEAFDGVSWTPVAGFTYPSGVLVGTAPSFAVDGSNLSIFMATPTGISLNVYNGSTWTGWTEIVTEASSILYLAATAPDTVHFVTISTENNRLFKVALNDGGWTVMTSRIAWGFNITSFDAERINGVDALVFTSGLPGTIQVSAVSTQVTKQVIPSGGLCVILYQYESWSDHRVIDLVDQWKTYRYRSRVRLTTLNDVLFLTCYSSEGTEHTPIQDYRIYSSKNGRHWSRGELFPMPEVSTEGLKLELQGTTLWALTSSATYHAPSTLWFGSEDTSTVMEVTDRVHRLSVNRSDAQQLMVTLDNRDLILDSSFVLGDTTLALILQLGGWDPIANEPVLIQTGLFEMDTIEAATDLPKNYVDLTGRDRLAWMASKSQSEQFHYWQPQGIGMDEYVDATGTGYGGLTHTATVKGSFKAFDNTLQLVSNNEEGVALSTFIQDAWNGSAHCNFSLALASNHEYAGLVFRAQDQDNLMRYWYDQDTDKLYLTERSGGEETTLWASSSKSWNAVTNAYWLRVEFRYSTIRMYSSTSSVGSGITSITWTLEAEFVLWGDAQYTIERSVLVQSGYVGEIGQGHSDIDTWSDDPGAIPFPDLIPGNVYDPIPDENPGLLPIGNIVFYATQPKVELGQFMTDHSCVYTDHSTGLAGLGVNAFYWAFANPFSYAHYLASSDIGIVQCLGVLTPGSSWTLLKSNAALWGDAARYTTLMTGTIRGEGWMLALSTMYLNTYSEVGGLTNQLAYSSNSGATWTSIPVPMPGNGNTYWNFQFFNFAFCEGDTRFGHVYAMGLGNDSAGGSYNKYDLVLMKSSDGGVTWSHVMTLAGSGTSSAVPSQQAGVFINYKRSDGSLNRDDGHLELTILHNFFDSAGHYVASEVINSNDGGLTYTVEDTSPFITAIPSVQHPISIFTHDGGVVTYSALTGVNTRLVHTDDRFETNTEVVYLGGNAMAQLNGWGYDRLIENAWSSSGFILWTDDGWISNYDISASDVVAYHEFRLADVQ